VRYNAWTAFRPKLGAHAKLVAKLIPAKVRKTSSSPTLSIALQLPTTTTAMALVQTNPDAYVIKPEAAAPAIDTSDWPLLLKNYSECMHQLFHSFAKPS
jgi:hypothetical protein